MFRNCWQGCQQKIGNKTALIRKLGYPTMQDEYYAHSLEGKPSKDWQPLEEHLKNVAEIAHAFGADDWGYLAGMR